MQLGLDFQRGSVSNLVAVYEQSRDWEREEGRVYYEKQLARLGARARLAGLPLDRVIAAFAALSPNNAESTNYMALDTCIQIVRGWIPNDSFVIAYPMNRAKALAILQGAPIDDHLRGQKVRSFYRNTLNPDSNEYVTIDGHMLSAWIGKRLILRRMAEIPQREYSIICQDFRTVATMYNLSTPRFQSILWITWKRLHRILYKPQRSFEWAEDWQGFRSGFRAKAGAYTTKVTLSIPAVERQQASDAVQEPIVW